MGKKVISNLVRVVESFLEVLNLCRNFVNNVIGDCIIRVIAMKDSEIKDGKRRNNVEVV